MLAGSAAQEGLCLGDTHALAANGRKKERRSQGNVFRRDVAFSLGMHEHLRIEARGTLPIAVVDGKYAQDMTTSGDEVAVFGELSDPERFSAAGPRLGYAIRLM